MTINQNIVFFKSTNFIHLLWFEFTYICQYLLVDSCLFFPFAMIIGWFSILNPSQYFVIFLCYSLKFSFTAFIVQWMSILDAIILMIVTAFWLLIKDKFNDLLMNSNRSEAILLTLIMCDIFSSSNRFSVSIWSILSSINAFFFAFVRKWVACLGLLLSMLHFMSRSFWKLILSNVEIDKVQKTGGI